MAYLLTILINPTDVIVIYETKLINSTNSNPIYNNSKKMTKKIYYVVETIRSVRVNQKGKKLYEVKWKDWDDKDNTWEPIENLVTVQDIVDQFEHRLAQKERKKNRLAKYAAAKNMFSGKTDLNKKQATNQKQEEQTLVKQGAIINVKKQKQIKNLTKRVKSDQTNKLQLIGLIDQQNNNSATASLPTSEKQENSHQKESLFINQNQLADQQLNQHKQSDQQQRINQLQLQGSQTIKSKTIEKANRITNWRQRKRYSYHKRRRTLKIKAAIAKRKSTRLQRRLQQPSQVQVPQSISQSEQQQPSQNIEHILKHNQKYESATVIFKQNKLFYRITYINNKQQCHFITDAQQIMKVNPNWLIKFLQGFYL